VSDDSTPKILIAHHLSVDLHQHVLIAGSLAAAYHHLTSDPCDRARHCRR
jgi:hypothetical protein